MNTRGWLGLAVLALLLAAPLAGAVHADGETTVRASTDDHSCGAEETCKAPSVKARLTVEHASVDSGLPSLACLTQITQGEEPGLPDCEVGEPSVDPGSLSTYASVEGLEASSENEREGPEEESASAATDPGRGLSIDKEAIMLIGALGLGASGAVAAIGLRRFIGLFLAPLASRLANSELLENETRRRIYETIDEQPGINLRGISDEVDVAWGTLLHHLKKLEDAHMVKSERYGKYRRFFKNGSSFSQEEQERIAALSTPSTARVAEYILENPGANQSEIGEEIGVTASTILFHVKRLKDVGLVEEEREGRYVHYYPRFTSEEAEHVGAA